MAPRLAEGFDYASAATQLNGHGTIAGSISIITGLSGSGVAIRADPSSSVDAYFTMELEDDITNGRVILHYRQRIQSILGSATVSLIRVRNTAGSTVFDVAVTSAGSLLVRRAGSTTVLTLASAFSMGVVAHWIVDVLIHGSAGTVEVYKDGESVADVSGVNTLGAAGDIRSVQFGGSQITSSWTFDYDDIFVEDETVRGQVDVTYKPADADVDSTGWTPSTGASLEEVVDEVPGSMTDYMVSSADEDNARFGITPGLGSVNPLCVQTVAIAHVEESSTSELELLLHSGASDDGGVSQVLTTTARAYKGVLNAVDPDTSAAWDPGDLDNVEIEAVHQVPA